MEQKWTKLWLAYPERMRQENLEIVTKIHASESCQGDRLAVSAVRELTAGITAMGGKLPEVIYETVCEQCGQTGEGIYLVLAENANIGAEGYRLNGTGRSAVIVAKDTRGLLYGAFALLRHMSMGETVCELSETVVPVMPLRMLNHWDNMDGSIERGYSGQSFFFVQNEIVINDRTVDYIRYMASVGINGIVINNVNVRGRANELITAELLPKLQTLSCMMQDYGIRLFLSVNFAAPIRIGGLESADPLDPAAIGWWKSKIDEIYRFVPELGGFLIKADSEGNHGPYAYGRDHAQGANMLADLLREHGGIVIWRCFVYNAGQDWRDKKTDRAKAAYEHFVKLDGQFRENVILQVKNGPMDFQIREPISPLFGAMKKTNLMLEVQVAQEYTGHQIDLCYLIPLYKEVLDFQTYADGEATVEEVVSGAKYGNRLCGMAAVTNTGDDENWTGHDLAAANTYGYGRLCMDPSLSAETIAREWIRQTIGHDAEVERVILDMLLRSREIYENYTCPLGIGWMVTPATHYGPSVNGYEYDHWGTYHRADHLGIGVDRTSAGTGYTMQYNEPNASMYEHKETCPEELLLFFHRVLYTEKLKSGKTLIQHIYDTHFLGVEQVKEMIAAWKTIADKVPERMNENVSERLDRQLYIAREWCDQVNSFFWRISGIPDEQGRTLY